MGKVALAWVLASGLIALSACDDGADEPSGDGGSTSAPGGAGGSTSVGGGGGSPPGCACDETTFRDEVLSSGEQLFDGVQLGDSTPIVDIVASPSSYEGQVVRIEGWIVEVCQSAGCYATLSDCDGNELNLKVTDGIVDFRDTCAPGEYAVGEGISQQAGEHGAQIFIEDHGAMIGTTVCPDFADGEI